MTGSVTPLLHAVPPRTRGKVGAFLVLSIGFHAALFAVLSRLPPPRVTVEHRPVEVQVVQVKREPPPPPRKVEEEKPKPRVKPPPLKVAKSERPPPPPEDTPPPPTEKAPEEAKPAPVVVGLTLSATTSAGTSAAAVGNTLYGQTGNTATDPSQVKGYAAKKYAPSYQLDTPPEVASEFKVPYPAQAKADGIEGAVVLKVSIDENGKVTHVQVVEGQGHGLDEAAVQALRHFTFKPALKGGEKVAADITYTYRFELPPSF